MCERYIQEGRTMDSFEALQPLPACFLSYGTGILIVQVVQVVASMATEAARKLREVVAAKESKRLEYLALTDIHTSSKSHYYLLSNRPVAIRAPRPCCQPPAVAVPAPAAQANAASIHIPACTLGLALSLIHI